MDKLFLLVRVIVYSRCPFLWVTPSVFLEKIHCENNIDTIITSGLHSLHYRFAIKTKLDLKWFADFRDPWTTGYHKALRLSNYATKSIRC
jgi:hypothetical protein